MMWWGDGWGGHAWGWSVLMHVVWWALVIIGVAALVRWGLGSRTRSDGMDEDRAMEIIRERYASGEISKEEFEERKRTLKG